MLAGGLSCRRERIWMRTSMSSATKIRSRRSWQERESSPRGRSDMSDDAMPRTQPRTSAVQPLWPQASANHERDLSSCQLLSGALASIRSPFVDRVCREVIRTVLRWIVGLLPSALILAILLQTAYARNAAAASSQKRLRVPPCFAGCVGVSRQLDYLLASRS